VGRSGLGAALHRGQVGLESGHPLPQARLGLAVLGEVLGQLTPDAVELRFQACSVRGLLAAATHHKGETHKDSG
jgi:hypothetical protein